MHRPPTTYQVDGTAIRTRRMELGLTQDDCAARAGITRPYLSQLETGARDTLRPPTYKRLRSALKSTTSNRLLAPPQEQHRKEPDGHHEDSPRPHPEDPG